ncbi:MAG: hypothetical protein DRR19_00455 [Candidatus Parabeggiatoa sp. nov. 1]|nr:MAG: hypothetical protein DRR19_00455 [Gammaproteobacteria bacterium]
MARHLSFWWFCQRLFFLVLYQSKHFAFSLGLIKEAGIMNRLVLAFGNDKMESKIIEHSDHYNENRALSSLLVCRDR